MAKYSNRKSLTAVRPHIYLCGAEWVFKYSIFSSFEEISKADGFCDKLNNAAPKPAQPTK